MVGSLQGRDIYGGSATVLALFLLGSIFPLGWAQVESSKQVSINADRNVVLSGEKITITGRVAGLGTNEKPLIRVFAPNGELVRADPLDVDADGNYSYELVLGGIANLVGDYTIVVSHGSREAETSVRLETGSPPTCTNYFVAGFLPRWELIVENSTYNIEYLIINATVADMSANIERKSIIVKMDTLGDGCFIVILPSEVIDAENRNFTAYVDNQPTVFREIEDNRNNTRSLHILFGEGDSQLEIVGTRIVPELNSFVISVMVAVILLPVLFLRWRMFGSLRLV